MKICEKKVADVFVCMNVDKHDLVHPWPVLMQH